MARPVERVGIVTVGTVAVGVSDVTVAVSVTTVAVSVTTVAVSTGVLDTPSATQVNATVFPVTVVTEIDSTQ
jgi:hypothetical protein